MNLLDLQRKPHEIQKNYYTMGSDKPTDDVILSNILEALDISANKLSTKMGYKSTNSIYQILDPERGPGISLNFANKLVEVYPRVNFLYATKGELPVLLDGGHAQAQSNFLGTEMHQQDYITSNIVEIKDLLKQILFEMKKNK